MRRFFRLSLVVFVFFFSGCMSDGAETIVLPDQNQGWGGPPSSVIPDAIREQFESLMPIYSGATPPDISGQYVSNPHTLVGSSDGDYSPGYVFGDRYMAFFTGANGKVSYQGKQGSGTSASEEVIIEVIGSGNDFTAYLVTTGESGGIWNKMSVVISGTLTSSGISNFHYAFIMLEKDDPQNELVDVNTYRIFKDGNGLAEKYTWLY